MAIQNRRGIFSDFDPDKMTPGEWAVVLSGDPDSKDGTSVYMCFHAGGVKRMATYADMLSNIENATEDIRNQFTEEILKVIKNAEAAIENANSATDKANGAATSAESAAQKADEIAKKTNQQYEEMKKQAALIGDGNVGTVTGPRVDFESLDSAAVVKEIPGKTVQEGTPDPEHSVPIHGVGDSGYFDGVLLQGYYSTTDGSFKVSNDLVCNANKISCKTGDTLSIIVSDKDVKETFFLFYEADGTFLGNNPSRTVKAPEGAEYFCFRIQKTGITPKNAGHIAITINGKYMAMIKGRTANLFDYSRLSSKTQGGATVTNNGDGSFTVSGSGNLTERYTIEYAFTHEKTIEMLKAGRLTLNFNGNSYPRPYVQLNYRTDGDTTKPVDSTYFTLASDGASADIAEPMLNNLTVKLYLFFVGNANQPIKPGIIKPILYQDGDGTYQPYKESSSLIPITQPLYAGDKVYQKDGELWLHRENAEVTFDGSEDENWVLYNGQFYTTKDDMKKSNSYVDNLFCDRFQTDINNSAKNDNTITGHWDSTLYPDKNWIYITKTDVESVSALKTWLQSNPVTVVYKLAVPVKKRITAEEAYNLRTYAPYSTIWTPDDMDPEFLVDTAKNLAGSYALEAYANREKGSGMIEKIEKIEQAMKNALIVSG